MKTILFSSLSVAGVILFLSFVPTEKRLTIDEAVKAKQVKANVTSKGGHSGSCVKLEVTNNLKEKVTVVISPGTVFKPNDEGDQDIFVVKEQVIVLNPSQKKVLDASGFCCQLHDSSPAQGSGFTVGVTPNEKLRKLAEHINQNSYPEDSYQQAVWCVSDNDPVTNLYSDDPSAVKPLREFICKLTGQKDDWYTTKQKREVTPERVIVSEPVKVSGQLLYESTQGDQITAELWGPDEKKMFDLGKPVPAQRSGSMTYGFNLTVQGFPKGKYKVFIYGNKKELLKQEFEI
jgi:hypothetical protein